MHLIDRFEQLSTISLVVLGAAMVAIIGYLDMLTAYKISLAAFYILPIFVLSWGAGRWGGIGVGIASAAARTLADLLSGDPHSSVLSLVWNALMRLIIYLVIAILLVLVKRYYDRQKELARIDPLTGAVNKRSFGELLNAEAARSRRYQRPLTIAYLDVDNFKAINDTFGHNSGDDLLRLFVTIMRSNIRASDTVGRLGGDEFALLLPETDETGARIVIAKIQSLFAQEMIDRAWPVTISVGSLTCSNDTKNTENLMAQADRLMYDAKLSGKNSARYATTR